MERTIREVYRGAGLSGLVLRATAKLLRPLVEIGSLVFFECDLRVPLPTVPPVGGIQFTELTLDDLHLFEPAGPRPVERARERFQRGERCFAGIETGTGRLVNYRWMTAVAGYIPEIDRYLSLRTGEAYIYDLETLPEFRNRGIDSYLRYLTYSQLQQRGFTRVYAYVLGENYISLKSVRRLLKRSGRIWYVRSRGGSSHYLVEPGSHLPELRPGGRR